ncbi:class I SAM-dependent methyltransferase [Mesorhizobium escarrei]|uniref:Class I SAM-dependent methyltransferase n=1 Tax=Mesorhizobium escarrei TaxID=666018 RepID=A0ABM9DGI0_9HYPH|nr:class I SAM-dependent methyltransferase [Mesorhizobium escarrei]CAH2395556.1 hypothetical protein MES5069_110106 [Mesorhizobium escarrei]
MFNPVDDITLSRERMNAKRMRHFVPNYLEPLLSKEWEIVSIGCGSGIDVEMLRASGYRAYGFDPSRDNQFGLRKSETRPFLRSGRVEDRPFGDKKFDFAYALEVIEHVGCRNYGTHLLPNWQEERRGFLAESLALLRPGGHLFLSTSNRVCPFDPGHKHTYSSLGRMGARYGVGVSVPWHEENFLFSYQQISKEIRMIVPTAKVTTAPIASYPSIAGEKSFKGRLVKGLLSLIDFEPLRRSPAAPILAVVVEV